MVEKPDPESGELLQAKLKRVQEILAEATALIDELKKKYLPRCARGEISAFALTEPDVGSEAHEHVVVDVGQPLGRVHDADVRFRQAQRRSQPPVGLRVHAAVARAGEVARDAVRFAVVERREDALS